MFGGELLSDVKVSDQCEVIICVLPGMFAKPCIAYLLHLVLNVILRISWELNHLRLRLRQFLSFLTARRCELFLSFPGRYLPCQVMLLTLTTFP